MKFFNTKLLTVLITITFVACGDFGDLNTDPTRPGGENANPVAIVPVMQLQTHRNLVSSAGRIAGIFMQYYTGFDAQQVAFTQYNLDESSLQNFWGFGLYTGSMRDCADIIERAEANGNIPHTKAIAQIYMAANLGIATNLWGYVPYSEAFLGSKKLNPVYDSQESIYNSILGLLDDAILNLSVADPQGPLGDLLGLENWTAVAHALKARFYIQLSKRDPQAGTKALAEISQAFTSNASSPIFNFEGNINGGNPLARFGIERPNTIIIAPFFDNLTNNDPRKTFYMSPNSDGDQLYFQNDNDNLFWSQFDSPSPLISYAELKFLYAEALLLTNASSGDVLAAIREAVRANMEFIGVNEVEIANYLNTITASDLNTIIVEKYKSLFGSNPIQVWNDFRRTGFPSITPNQNGTNGSNPSGVVPRRILYPISERLSNSESYDNAINAQGGHLLDDELWVFSN